MTSSATSSTWCRPTPFNLVIDSCNSFFVINPRKPGGRRWASPKDVRAGFSKRYPHVGAFLSTSAEGEVFEWSEIQGGIFSHEVRSGLSGAADANGDGVITYEELAAFVEAANARIRNAHYRPKVFARGPFAKASAPLFESRAAAGRRIQLDAQARRLWVRDRDGTRLIDVHKEAGSPLTLVLPVTGDEPLYVQEQRERVATRRKILQWTLPPGVATFVLAAVEPAPAPENARGADAVFRRLFAKPFGPSYFASFRARPAEREEVYGISAREGVRIRHYLRHFAEASRRSRRVEGIAGASSALMLGLGSALYADRRAIGRTPRRRSCPGPAAALRPRRSRAAARSTRARPRACTNRSPNPTRPRAHTSFDASLRPPLRAPA